VGAHNGDEDVTVTQDLLERARTGDGEAFRALTEPHRHELRVHCYRILGSLQDAEDVLQETLLAAWRGLDQFEGRSSVRAWLYQIATNRCLNSLRTDARRPRTAYQSEVVMPPPTRVGDAMWLQPYPDALLDGMPDEAAGPDARYELKESVSLAFLAAVQALVPRQRAVLLLRDVLGYRAAEVAAMLGSTEHSVNSALKRARAVLAERLPDHDRDRASLPASPRERELAARFAEAFERRDVTAVVALLTDDAWLTMPPLPLEYQGPAEIAHFLTAVAYRDGRRYRLIPTRANGQPAFGCYVLDGHSSVAHAHGIMVLTLATDGISMLTRFTDNSVMPAFGFPRTLPR
jgi:RNA polymerase sigma-70 factor (ECF subfamily)